MTCRAVAACSSLLLALACGAPGGSLNPARSSARDSAEQARSIDFNRDIRPILSDNCFFCHGPDASHREAHLRLDRESSAKADLGGYRAIVAGAAQASELMQRITAEEDFDRMPPEESGKTLTPGEVALLAEWINQGAQWSEHWAFVAPQRAPLPEVGNADWPVQWLDYFTLAGMEAAGLSEANDADATTLLRRLSFDLIGLPPTTQEVDLFLADGSPGAYERQVDRLLSSKHYGERMAMFWLDLVRFADTVGYHGDQDHNISPYRDYVIDAFNDNMPFDQFTREQLAGDLIADAGVDQRIASAYNRLLQTSHEGGVQPKEYLAIYGADRVRNVSVVWMGATMGCAQCHDHKFDPYTARDFYSLQAFFADIDEADHLTQGGDRIPTPRPPEIKVLPREVRPRVAELQGLLAQASSNAEQAAPGADSVRRWEVELKLLRSTERAVMVTVAKEPRTIRILPRGDWLDDSGPEVEPHVPAFLPPLDVKGRRAHRLDLAQWLTSSSAVGGMTARVFMNRLWYLFFGQGLARNLGDFGAQGEAPRYAALLDNLALEFQDGWDVRRMVKSLVMSRTYRQSSIVTEEQQLKDPANRTFCRQSRFRLPAEMVRDTALAISGLLDRTLGGASVKPYQPAAYYQHLNFPVRKYQHDQGSGQWRRGVYMHWQRMFLHPMLKAFDAPTREECTVQRSRSNTPLAALVLLNDPSFVEAARVFAQRILRQGGASAEQRLAFAFRAAVSRPPDDFEESTLLAFLAAERARFDASPADATQFLAVGQAPLAALASPAELAAWTSVARSLLNLAETITRN